MENQRDPDFDSFLFTVFLWGIAAGGASVLVGLLAFVAAMYHQIWYSGPEYFPKAPELFRLSAKLLTGGLTLGGTCWLLLDWLWRKYP